MGQKCPFLSTPNKTRTTMINFFFCSLFGFVAILMICLCVWAYVAYREHQDYLNKLK